MVLAAVLLTASALGDTSRRIFGAYTTASGASVVLAEKDAAAHALGGCHLKPGEPVVYKALCAAQQTKAACVHLNETCVWTASPLARFSLQGSWATGGRPAFAGSGSNAGLSWAVYGGTARATAYGSTCPDMPVGDQCGWTIDCPTESGHSCLAPAEGHGCQPVAPGTNNPQCHWPNATAAKLYCGEWAEW